MGEALELERIKWRVADFHKMGEAVILAADERVELIEGEIIRMAPIGRLHAWAVDRLGALFVLGARDRAHVSIQNPLVLSDHDEPQPDLMLLRPPASRYKTEPPRSEDVLLLVEIADTTLARDLDIKLPLHARSGVPELWVFDLSGARLLAFSDAHPGGTYAQQREFGRSDRVAPGALPDLQIVLAEILG